MSYIIAIVLTLSAILGLSQPASANVSASQPDSLSLSTFQSPSAPTSIACEEDMTCWDCATMGNLQCGPIAHDVDAFQSIDAMGIVYNPTNVTMSLTYVSTHTTQPTREDLALGQFAIPSANVEYLWHIMQWDVVTSC